MGVDEFDDLLPDTILVEPLVSRDDYGTPTYGAAVSYRGRVNGAQKQFVDLNGVQRLSQAIIYLGPSPVLSPLDRITLPATFTPSQPPIARIDQVADEAGPHHQKVWV